MDIKGLGTLLNVILIIAGGLIGMVAGKWLSVRIRETLMDTMGVSVIFVAIGGAVSQMLVITDGKLTTQGTIMMIVSLALGALIGELINLDEKLISLGNWLKKKSGSSKDPAFVDAFVTASCTVCIGAMAVIGAIQDGIYGDVTILFTKGILDAVIICIMAASMGKGCLFSAIPVAVFQGGITIVAFFVGPFMPQAALDNLSYVGSVLIFCVGLNLIREKKIKVANLLPAIVIAAIWGFVA